MRTPMPMPLSEITDALRAAIAPVDLVRKRAVRLRRGVTDIVLVGTLHGGHLGQVALPVGFLRNVIEFYAPDKIGIEARPRDLATGLIGLAPIDMAFIWAIAGSTGIPVFGFDWWSEAEYETLAAADATIDFNTPHRNDRMAESILAALDPAGSHLLFTGYAHVHPLRDRLLACGFAPDRSFELRMDPARGDDSDEVSLQPLLRPYLLRSIEHLDRYLLDLHQRQLDNRWTRRVMEKRNGLARVANVSAAA